jgi:hypothetical protein
VIPAKALLVGAIDEGGEVASSHPPLGAVDGGEVRARSRPQRCLGVLTNCP